MPSSSFGMFNNNGAPLPPVFAGNNPTGGPGVGGGSGLPNFGLFNPMSQGVVSPTANMPIFSGVGNTGLAGLSSGFGDPYGNGNMLREFQRAYGKGTGAELNQIMTQGLFNPQVAAAFLNAMQPGIARGEGNILNAFGAEGSRFSSAAALGLGDFESQVNLNENQVLAQMFQQSQQEQLSLLSNTLPTLHTEEANQGGWLHDLLGGLEVAGGLIAAPFTGGLSLGLVGAGVNTIVGGGGGGGSTAGGSNPFMGLQGLFNKGNNSPTGPSSAPDWTQFTTPPFVDSTSGNFWDTYSRDALSGSAGDAIYG